jgi:peptide/nickel transport system permease protein
MNKRIQRFMGFLKLLSEDMTGALGLVIVAVFVLLAFLAPAIAPADPLEQNLENIRLAPSLEHLMGTDEFGRDLLSRVVHGARISLSVSFAAVVLSTAIGVIIGLFAGYFGGILDEVTMRLTDVLLSLPYFVLAIVIVSALGPGLTNSMLAIAISHTPSYIRLVRGSALSIKNEDYIKAAYVSGNSELRILFFHVLPNIMAPVIVLTTLHIADAFINLSSLSFIGLGAQPPTPEWGTIVATARAYLLVSPHLFVFPGLALLTVVLGFNLLGDAMRDILDPRLRGLIKR